MRAFALRALVLPCPSSTALRSLLPTPTAHIQRSDSPSSSAGTSSRMGQVLSLLPLPGRVQRRELAAKAAAKGRAAIDRPEDEDPDLWMICGLGNPGPRYEDTRHNVGFMAVDALARREGIAMDRLQETALVGRGRLCGKKVVLVKPMTFMNVSGEPIGKLSRFYRIPPARVLVIYDDLDLDTAQVRLRAKGGHGGHNGMKSIASHLQGTKDFPRIRIGIGRPPGSQPVVSWVLQDFSKAERENVDVAVQECIDLLRAVLIVGMERAVSGIRVDRDGKPIKPAHSNGKAGDKQQEQKGRQQGKQPKQAKQAKAQAEQQGGEQQEEQQQQPIVKRQKQGSAEEAAAPATAAAQEQQQQFAAANATQPVSVGAAQ